MKVKDEEIELGLHAMAKRLGMQSETLRHLAIAGVIRARRTLGKRGSWKFLMWQAERDFQSYCRMKQ